MSFETECLYPTGECMYPNECLVCQLGAIREYLGACIDGEDLLDTHELWFWVNSLLGGTDPNNHSIQRSKEEEE